MSDFRQRLDQYLESHSLGRRVTQLTQDASTREYFRIGWNGGKAIACVYPEPFVAREHTYLDVTALFLAAKLPVATVFDFDEKLGVIIQEDFGDTILRNVLERSSVDEKENLFDESISLIARIQEATKLAFETGSIASKLRFDTEKLFWELNFFKEHYFTTFLKNPLDHNTDTKVTAEFKELSAELETMAKVLCHRDFHAANLMLDHDGNLRIIDHQDARIGSPAYDLVSLLLDRITDLPTPEWLSGKQTLLLNAREDLGLSPIPKGHFSYEFRLQTVQRCLKAAGTFSYQSVNRGKTYFIPFIKPMFQIVLRAAEDLGRFPILREILRLEIKRGKTEIKV
jgi:aminoglycoside/choline kinase family phosphotransferase